MNYAKEIPHCFCGRGDIGEDWVACDGVIEYGRRFHLGCTGLTETPLNDWTCRSCRWRLDPNEICDNVAMADAGFDRDERRHIHDDTGTFESDSCYSNSSEDESTASDVVADELFDGNDACSQTHGTICSPDSCSSVFNTRQEARIHIRACPSSNLRTISLVSG